MDEGDGGERLVFTISGSPELLYGQKQQMYCYLSALAVMQW